MSTQSRFAATPDGTAGASTASKVRDLSSDEEALNALSSNESDRGVLIKGGVVLSQDAGVGDFARADVLIRGNKIVDVGPDLSARQGDAAVLDAAGMVVTPGFVDSHVHAWEGQLRSAAPTLDFGGYLGFTAFGYGPLYRPHDNYVGTLATALVALNAGITTIVDNSHNSLSPDHSSAAVEALIDAGIRGVHASGAPVSGAPEGWPADIKRLRDEYFVSDDQLVTLRLFDLYPSAELWSFADDEDLWISHEMGAHIENVDEIIADLDKQGLLTARHTFNHCFDLSDEVWRRLAGSGAAVNVCPRSDAAFGLGSATPPIDVIRSLGLVPGISGDNEVSYGLSMFSEMQTLLNGHRGRTFKRALTAAEDDDLQHLSPQDVLQYATVGGALNAGLSDRIGSITVGKQADLVLIDATAINTAPLTNALSTVTAFAHAGNVDTVIVGGQARKFRGELVGQDVRRVQSLIEASRDYLFAAKGLSGDVLAAEGTATG